MLLVEKLNGMMTEPVFWYLIKSFSLLIEQEAFDTRNDPELAGCMHGVINKHALCEKDKKGQIGRWSASVIMGEDEN